MRFRTSAGRGRRARRALLGAAVPAVLAAAALPAAADAATVSINPSVPVLGVSAAPGETNQIFVRVNGSKLVISDNTAPITAGNGCVRTASGNAECPISVDFIGIQLGDGNDRLEYAAPHMGFVAGQDGHDLFLGALRQAAPGRPIQPLFVQGDAGVDTITYQFADRAVDVDTADNPNNRSELANDGRPGDLENVEDDIEIIEGSSFGDRLFGSDRNDTIRGGAGNDIIAGRGGDDFIDEGPAPSGADTISGGDGARDRVSYTARLTAGVTVALDGVRNDGATGEQDNLSATVENIGGTAFRDVITGSAAANVIDGFGGQDTIDGLGGNDALSAGTGNNGLFGRAGNDVLLVRNGEIDNADCGLDSDTLDRDTSENVIAGCEKAQVGVLRLASKAVVTDPDRLARVNLRWRHPESWRALRSVELRLTRGGAPVGSVSMRPHAGRMTAEGGVTLVRRRSGLRRDGKTVTAQLALRLDEGVAGQRLRVEVEATDVRGRRQVERAAGTIRVAP